MLRYPNDGTLLDPIDGVRSSDSGSLELLLCCVRALLSINAFCDLTQFLTSPLLSALSFVSIFWRSYARETGFSVPEKSTFVRNLPRSGGRGSAAKQAAAGCFQAVCFVPCFQQFLLRGCCWRAATCTAPALALNHS